MYGERRLADEQFYRVCICDEWLVGQWNAAFGCFNVLGAYGNIWEVIGPDDIQEIGERIVMPDEEPDTFTARDVPSAPHLISAVVTRTNLGLGMEPVETCNGAELASDRGVVWICQTPEEYATLAAVMTRTAGEPDLAVSPSPAPEPTETPPWLKYRDENERRK